MTPVILPYKLSHTNHRKLILIVTLFHSISRHCHRHRRAHTLSSLAVHTLSHRRYRAHTMKFIRPLVWE